MLQTKKTGHREAGFKQTLLSKWGGISVSRYTLNGPASLILKKTLGEEGLGDKNI